MNPSGYSWDVCQIGCSVYSASYFYEHQPAFCQNDAGVNQVKNGGV